MQITEVTPERLDDLERGLRALARDLSDPYRLDRADLHHALYSDHPACHGLVVGNEGDPQGVALFSPVMSTLAGSAGVYVSDLWVAPEARGGGLGLSLLVAVIETAKARWNAGYVRLAAYHDNPRSIAFYRRHGFEQLSGESTMRLSGAAFRNFGRV